MGFRGSGATVLLAQVEEVAMMMVVVEVLLLLPLLLVLVLVLVPVLVLVLVPMPVTGGGSECTVYFASLCKFTVSHIPACYSHAAEPHTFLLRIGRAVADGARSRCRSPPLSFFDFRKCRSADIRSLVRSSARASNAIKRTSKSACPRCCPGAERLDTSAEGKRKSRTTGNSTSNVYAFTHTVP